MASVLHVIQLFLEVVVVTARLKPETGSCQHQNNGRILEPAVFELLQMFEFCCRSELVYVLQQFLWRRQQSLFEWVVRFKAFCVFLSIE